MFNVKQMILEGEEHLDNTRTAIRIEYERKLLIRILGTGKSLGEGSLRLPNKPQPPLNYPLLYLPPCKFHKSSSQTSQLPSTCIYIPTKWKSCPPLGIQYVPCTHQQKPWELCNPGITSKETTKDGSYCGWTKSCTTLKPWEAFFGWYLQVNHPSRVFSVVQDFVHPQQGSFPHSLQVGEFSSGSGPESEVNIQSNRGESENQGLRLIAVYVYPLREKSTTRPAAAAPMVGTGNSPALTSDR